MSRFIRAGQLRQALDLADRWLPDGAPDELLQMLIEEAGRESPVAKRGKQEGGKNLAEDSWQHCIRLRDKEVAAELALK